MVKIFGADTTIYALRRTMSAMTMRIDGGPAVRIRVPPLSTLNGMSGTVLLVEDEPSVGELVRGYLSRDGYRVIWVRNGDEALVELERHPIRLVHPRHRPARQGRLRRLPRDARSARTSRS